MEQADIFNQLNYLAQMAPTPFYWLDLEGKFVGLNKKALAAIGAKKVEDVIGKNAYDIYPKELADIIWKDVQKVINKATDSQIEDVIVDLTTGLKRYYIATRSPIIDSSGKVIGVIGTSIDITAEKEAEMHKLENERLKLENEIHEAQAMERQERQLFVDNLIRTIQASVTSFLHKDINIKQDKLINRNIYLTLREEQVLYAIYHRKNSKSAANYLSKQLKKNFTSDSVNTVVSKFLYPKFEVNSLDELINKALILKMIPLLLPEKPDRKKYSN